MSSRFITEQIPQKQYSSIISITTTQDYAIPSSLRKCSIFVLAAGGGGGGGGASSNDTSSGAFAFGGNGGSCGEIIRIDFNDLYSLGATLKCVIGAGGSGGGGGAASASDSGNNSDNGSNGAEGSPSSISINGFRLQAKGGAGGDGGDASINVTAISLAAGAYTYSEIGDKNDYYSYIITSLNLAQIIRYGNVARGANAAAGNTNILPIGPISALYHPLISDTIQPFVGSYFNISGTLIDTIGGYANGTDGAGALNSSLGAIQGWAMGGIAGAPSAIANSPSNAAATGGVTWQSASGTAGGAGVNGTANTGVGGGGGGGSSNNGASSNPKTATGGAGGDGGSGKIIILY